MQYYSAIRKNEIMPFAATWMDTESVMLNEVSQTEKYKYPTSFSIKLHRVGQMPKHHWWAQTPFLPLGDVVW